MIDGFSNRLSQQVREGLEAKIEELSRKLVTTKAIDYADYCGRIGHVQGLRDALEILTDIEHLLGRAEDNAERAPLMARRYEE